MTHESTVQELKPINIGLLETIRLIRRSYANPLQHAQELQGRFGNAVMQKFFRITFVNLYGAEAHRLALINADQVFSNKEAWDKLSAASSLTDSCSEMAMTIATIAA